MSKELEALEGIRLVMKKEFNFPINLTEEYKIIQEALKRNEPMKVETTPYRTNKCPICHHTLSVSNQKYCDECGKALDWTK